MPDFGAAPPPVDSDLAGNPDDQLLHPAVAQALGLTPSGDPGAAAPGDLHPALAQALGLQPPALPPDVTIPGDAGPAFAPPPASPPPTPDQLAAAAPTAVDHPPSAQGSTGDYEVPAADIGRSAPAAAKTAPSARPATPDQQLAQAQQKQAQADNASMGAIAGQRDVTTAEAADELAARTAHDDEAKRIGADRKAFEDDFAKTHAEKQAYVDSARNAVDNYKVDQNKYWHDLGLGKQIGWGISMALAGLGQALQKENGPNPVIQMLQEHMHQAVVAQMDERDQLKEKNARAEHALDKYDQYSQSREAQLNLLDSLNDKRLANTLLTAAAKYKGAEAQAAAKTQAAALLQDSAAKADKSAQFAASYDMQKKQLAISQSANAIAAGHLSIAQQAERRAQKLQDLEYGPGGFKEQELGLKAADEARKALADKKKNVADNGVYNPTTGNGLLTSKGHELMNTADQIEAATRKDPSAGANAYIADLRSQATTPQAKAQVDQLEQQVKSDPSAAAELSKSYVANLRNTAITSEVATVPDKEVRAKVQDTVDYGQQLYSTADEIQQFLRSDPSVTDRAAWGKLQAKWGSLIANESKYLGAKASSREFDAISKHILNYNPDSIWLFNPNGRLFGSAPAEGQLDGLKDEIKQGVDVTLKGHGIKDGWTPSSPLSGKIGLGNEQTDTEIGEDARPGLIGQAKLAGQNSLNAIFRPVQHDTLTPDTVQTDAEQQAANRSLTTKLPGGEQAQILKNSNLGPQTEQQVLGLVQKADGPTTSNADRTRIIEQLAAPVIANDRPELSAGILAVVRAQNPAIYKEILSKLPVEQQKQITKFDNLRLIVPGI